jgi:hypothetical protein
MSEEEEEEERGKLCIRAKAPIYTKKKIRFHISRAKSSVVKSSGDDQQAHLVLVNVGHIFFRVEIKKIVYISWTPEE